MPEPRPEIRREVANPDGSVTLRLFVPAAMPLFAGHFPGAAILPGVVQIHWAVQLGLERFPIDGRFSRMVNIKFQKLIRPDSTVDLVLAYDPARRQLAFAYTSAAGPHASGKLEFAVEAVAWP